MAPPEPFTELLDRLQRDLVLLPDKPEETPETTLRALWCAAAGEPRSAEAAASVDLVVLGGAGLAELRRLIDSRLAGTPLAHLTGRQRFCGVELLAGPEALVPRKETEILAGVAIGRLDASVPATVFDVCTGSGNLAAAIAVARPLARIQAADLSAPAVALARRNMAFTGVDDRVTVTEGDLFAAFPDDGAGQVDLVVCNPPYISSARVPEMAPEIAEHEPRLAFDGGGFGLTIVGRLITEAPAWLKPGGWLCFEIGRGQGGHWLKKLSQRDEYDLVEPAVDGEGEVRAISARRG